MLVYINESKILEVVNCNELENLIEPARDQDSTQLHENNSTTCFPCLGYLTVYQCDKLKTVFPLSVVQSLPKLRGIFLCKARKLEEIFTDDLNEEYVSGSHQASEENGGRRVMYGVYSLGWSDQMYRVRRSDTILSL